MPPTALQQAYLQAMGVQLWVRRDACRVEAAVEDGAAAEPPAVPIGAQHAGVEPPAAGVGEVPGPA
ncbi:MAG: hypothetical protein WCC36_16105, partial [Gammaproteobacteria bacterium]